MPSTLSSPQRASCAALAYVVGTLVSSPMDVIKTRLQANVSANIGIFATALSIQRLYGIRGFWRGIGLSLLMMPGMIVQYTLIDSIRASFPSVPVPVTAAAACVIGVSVVAPIEKLKTVAMAGRLATGCVGGTFSLRNMYGGYGSHLTRDIPYVCIYWMVYDRLRVAMHIDAEPDPKSRIMKGFVGGVVAGTVACTCSNPADVVKTRIQLSPVGNSHVNAVTVVRSIIAIEGTAVLMTGLRARCLSLSLYSGVTLAMYELTKWACIEFY